MNTQPDSPDPEPDIEFEQWKAEQLIKRAAYAGFIGAAVGVLLAVNDPKADSTVSTYNILASLVGAGLSFGVLNRSQIATHFLVALYILATGVSLAYHEPVGALRLVWVYFFVMGSVGISRYERWETHERLMALPGEETIPELNAEAEVARERMPEEPRQLEEEPKARTQSHASEVAHACAKLAVAALAFVAMARWPYAFYQYANSAIFLMCIWGAIVEWKNRIYWALIFIALGLAFSPLFPARGKQGAMSRETHQILDACAGGLFIVSCVRLRWFRRAKRPKSQAHNEPGTTKRSYDY